MMRHRAAVVVAALLVGLAAGCGGSDDVESAGQPSGTPAATVSLAPPSSFADLCDRVTQADLSAAAGVELSPVASDDPGQTCTAEPGSERLAVSWRLTVPAESLDQVATDLQLDLDRRPVELPGHVAAVLLTGDLMDQRIARVVTVTGGHTVMVDATASRLDDRAADDARLERVAREVAAAYAR
ncbi:hypothetical protein [Nocardioides conyzicola]|uniref:DUF3558 domain-containing protein n=1 Tax=Nocardioides conyzicola TaxID=1651781 RepID=A0ABP8XT48_9ACTN